MQTGSVQPLRRRIEFPLNDIARDDVLAVRVRVAEEIGEADGREGEVVGVVRGVRIVLYFASEVESGRICRFCGVRVLVTAVQRTSNTI